VKKFEICVFNEGAIYYDKLIKHGCKSRTDKFIYKSYPDRPDRETIHSNIQFIFKN
jgi:hypothetical protein